MSGNDEYTKLLLHCNGADESTTFTDSSYASPTYTVTTVGSGQIDTAQQKFGTSSGLFNGISDYLSVPDSDDWYMASDKFTIDFWVRFSSVDNNMTFFYQGTALNRTTLYWDQSTTNLYFSIMSGGVGKVYLSHSSWSPDVDTWYHLSVIRGWADNVHDWALTIDGTAVDTDTDSDVWPQWNQPLLVVPTIYGWVDEFRISKGIARWTENFNVPIEEYTTGWTGTFMGVTNPSKIYEIDVTNIIKIMGVESDLI